MPNTQADCWPQGNGMGFFNSTTGANAPSDTGVSRPTSGKGEKPTVMRRLLSFIPFGGAAANIFNLASATLGAGILVLPSGFHDSGIIFAIILLVVCCLLTIYSIRILVLTKEKTGFRSYEEMAQGMLCRGADYFTALLMFVFCFGTCVGYVISVGDLLQPLLSDPSAPEFLRGKYGSPLLVSAIWFLGMLPLSLPKQINSLRHASAVGVSLMIFFVCCMIVHSASNGMRHGLSSELRLFNSGLGPVNGLTLFIFAFICQVNCFEIYEEMEDPTPRRMTLHAFVGMVIVALLYFLSGFFGYADFGDAASDSVLRLYKLQGDVMMIIGYVGVAVKLCVGFAICIQPSRDAVYYVLRWGKTSDVPMWPNFFVSGLLAFIALILGLFIPSVKIVFNFLGGLCGAFLGFLLPAFFYMYAGDWSLKTVGWMNFITTYALIIAGVVALVFGTGVAIFDEV